MEESLITGSELRSLLYREHTVEFHGNDYCIYHFILGVTRMHIPSLNMYFCTCSIEVLILQFPYLATIHCIGIFCTEFLHIKLVNSTPYLLVGSKANLNFTVLELRMLHNILHCTHDLGNTGLVICAKKGCSICGNEGLSNILFNLREICHRQFYAKRCIQHNVLPIVVLNYLWLYILAACIRCCINVGNETHCWHILIYI